MPIISVSIKLKNAQDFSLMIGFSLRIASTCSGLEEKVESISRISSDILVKMDFRVNDGKNPFTTTQSSSTEFKYFALCAIQVKINFTIFFSQKMLFPQGPAAPSKYII